MENLFGLPMTWLAASLAGILAMTSLVIIVMAMRNRILLKLALRNIPRRRAQTVLIVIGLMLSTTIISASLAIGDTVTGSIRGVVLDALGHTDLRLRTPLAGGDAESAVFADDPDGTAFFVDRYLDSETLTLVTDIADADDRIDGVMPQIREVLPVLDTRSQLTESRMTVVGFDTARQDGFGDIRTADGPQIRLDQLGEDEVLINEAAAEELNAGVGDEIVIVSPGGRHAFIAREIIRDSGLAANDRRTIMTLSAMQRIMGRNGQVNRIDLSASGGVTGGVDLAEDVAESLRVQFTDTAVAQQLFDVLRAPDVIEILTAYADDGGNGLLSSGAEEDLRALIGELTPGDTVTARQASRVGAMLLAMSDEDASTHLLEAIGDKFLAASSAVLTEPVDVSGQTDPTGMIGALLGSPDGLSVAGSLVDSLAELGAGADITAYAEVNTDLPAATIALLLAAGKALAPGGSFVPSADVAVTDEFRSKAADSTLAAHILAALEVESDEHSGRRDLTIAVTFLFSGLQVLTVDELKRDSLEFAELVGNILLMFFTIFGSFSIIVGLLLIFLVFVMLAAARSTEMGIARAVGTKRRHLVQMFTYEGFAYAFGAALIGTVLGILASLVLVRMLTGAIDDEEDSTFVFKYSFTLTSVAAAFSAGMLLTLATVAISAYRVSRLNIVVAIRGLPEEFVPSDTPPLLTRLLRFGQAILGPLYQLYRLVTAHRRREGAILPLVLLVLHLLILPWLVLAALGLFRVFQPYLAIGWPLMVVGAILAALGLVLGWAAFWTLGVSLALVGIGLFIRRMLRRNGVRESAADRASYTFIGATVLVFWALPFDSLEWLTGELTGSIEMFILSGTWMVASAVWLVMYNADLLTRGLLAVFGRSPQIKAILRPAIAYPMTAKFRTGLTVAMFSLVIFTMMVFAILNTIGSDIDETPDRVTGGFDIRAETSLDLPVTDIEAAIESAPNLNSADFDVITAHTDIPAEARQSGAKEQRFLGLGVRGAERKYLQETRLEITHFDPAYLPGNTPLNDPAAVSAAVWSALAEDPSLAVVSGDLLEARSGEIRFGGAQFGVEGLSQDEDGPVDAFDVEVRQARGRGAMTQRTVIGAMDQFTEAYEFDGGPVANLVTRVDVFTDISGESLPFTTFRIRLSEGADPGHVAAAMETVFLDNSMEAIDTLDEIRTGIAQNNAFSRLFQGFMGLGLVVGVASLGVLSFRAVVERRHAIGMMRAIGYKSRMIQIQFLLESIFVTVLGSALGVGLGALISWNIINDIGDTVDDISFDIPWLTVMTIVGIALVASLVATFIPARQAARIYPSEALRYE
ncbi:MAG: FtsX-like permease family protein [Dehalococcoidia bacterium]|nr:FtsX-like permease family protein [Dehalococcoidia bacterium]